MNSALFRRRTRKGGRCMRGGSRSIDGQIANLTKSITYLSKRRNDPLYRRQQASNNAQIVRQTRNLKLLQNQKAQANAEAKAKANAAAKAQANVNAAAAATAQAAATASAAAEETANATNTGILKQITNATTAALTGNPAPTVAASNAIANKSDTLAKLAQRANALAANIRAMVGGKRNRRTRRK